VPEQRLQLIDGADRDIDLVGGSDLGIHAGRVQPRQDPQVRPAARSSDASAMSVVPSHPAPASTAARATV
jgi:hypothetical protein